MRRPAIVRSAAKHFAAEKALSGAGFAGIALAAVCLAGVAVHGPVRAPEGKLLDAATFDLGVGVFLLTIALVLPLADFPERRRNVARGLFLAFGTYGIVLETLQSFRGLDPRFSPLHSTADMVAGRLFGLTAALLTGAAVMLGLRFFRRGVLADRPVLRMGLRYGCVAVSLSFLIGILMSINLGREVGAAGDLLPAHGLGVHGIQTLPLAAILLLRGGVPRPAAWLHAAGAGWLVATIAVLAHALSGRAPLDISGLLVLAAAGLGLWGVVIVRGLRAWARARVSANDDGVARAT